MAKVKVDRHELAALGAAALLPAAMFAQVAAALAKGMTLQPQETAFVEVLLNYGVVHWTNGQLELNPVLSKALANLAGGPADVFGAFVEFRPAIDLDMMRIPASKIPMMGRA